jgi:hypothetical protein
VGIVFIAALISFGFKDQITDIIKGQVGTKFEYNDFKFEKFYYGDILMYKTEIFVVKNEQVVRYDLLLRNDPRELDEKIDVSVTNSKIRTRSYFSLAPETSDCNNTMVAAWKIGEFLGALGINNSGATTDISTIINTPYANDTERVKTCEDAVGSSVIILQKSLTNSSYISQEYQGEEYEDCFVLNYRDCENIEVVERFILMLISELNKKE